MEKYINRAKEVFQKDYDESLKVISIFEDEKYMLITLVTDDLEKNNAGMWYPRFAYNKHTGVEYYGIGFGFIYDPSFQDLNLRNMRRVY